MIEMLSHPAIDALARTLAHFVWQGAAIGLITLISFRAFRASASARYLAGVAGLAAMLAAPIATYFIVSGDGAAAPLSATSSAAATALSADATVGAASAAATGNMNWMAIAVLAWMVGAFGFMLRLAGGWIIARRYVTRAIEPATEEIVLLAQELAARMRIRRAIAVVQSTAVVVPVMVGWLKPTIVLPIAALTNLTPAQVEALIAHELAHVRRYDYLVNLLQSTVEALLFFHPAVWWLSRRVRADRELCCDDLAVSVCDRLVYATALTDLAMLTSSGVALAATDGDLLGRVRRILGRGETSNTSRPGAIPLMAIALVSAFLVPIAFASVTPQHPVTSTHAAIAPAEHAAMHPQATPSPSPKPSPSPSPKVVEKTRAELELELAKKHLELTQHLKEKESAELKHKLDEVRAAQSHLKTERDAQKKVEIDALLRELEAQLARTKQLYEKGLVSQSQVNDISAKYAEALARYQHGENAQHAASGKLYEAMRDLERARSLVEKGLMTTAQLAEIERAVTELQQSQLVAAEAKALNDRNQTDARALQEQLLARRNAQAQQAAQEREQLKTALARATAIHLDSLAPTAQVQAGDWVSLTISGEPDLPSRYTVDESGAIRVPFVGAVKVAGLTTAQVRDAIGKALADKKLGSTNQVTVSVSRPR